MLESLLSLNGNAIALAGQEFLTIASQLNCPVEINIFYRTPERMGALLGHLKMLNVKLGLDVEILGGFLMLESKVLKGQEVLVKVMEYSKQIQFLFH